MGFSAPPPVMNRLKDLNVYLDWSPGRVVGLCEGVRVQLAGDRGEDRAHGHGGRCRGG